MEDTPSCSSFSNCFIYSRGTDDPAVNTEGKSVDQNPPVATELSSKANVHTMFEPLKDPYESLMQVSADYICKRADQYLEIVIAYSRNAFKSLQELENKVEKLKREVCLEYKDVQISENVEIRCNNVFRKNCSGPAVVSWKSCNYEVDENVSENIRTLITEINRGANEMYIMELESFVDASEKLVDLSEQLVKRCQNSLSISCDDDSIGPLVNKVFFKIVSAVDSPKFLNFAPFSAIFEKCLMTLGPNCLKTQSFSSKILNIIVERTYLVPLLSHYFDVDQSVFVESYTRILSASSSGSLNSKMSENLLRKFHLDSWLNSLPSFVDVKSLLSSLLHYFAKVGTRMSVDLSCSICMQHFLAIDEYNSALLLEIVFPLIAEIECQSPNGLPKEFYEVFKSCCKKRHSCEEVPDIMISLTAGLNCNENVPFGPGRDLCENLLKPELLSCFEIFCDEYIANVSANLDFTTSVFHLQAVIDNAWTNVTQIFDNFWLNRNVLKLICSKIGPTQFLNQIHIEKFIQMVNKMNISFHNIRPTFDIAYSGSRYKNALNYLVERLVCLKIDDKTEEIIRNLDQPFFLESCLGKVCWSVLLPGPNDAANLSMLFDSKHFHKLALHIFVSVNWACYLIHQSSMEIYSANQVSEDLLMMALKFVFHHKLESDQVNFCLLSEWNSQHESSTVDNVTLSKYMKYQ